ncbi:MAG: hypothetical protein LBM98_04815 [Oscillospiraceae bacterium]|nr:hypothetical protein [Oscillospiraceae bacterium]
MERRGEPPRRYAAPLPRGEFTGEGGFETRPYGSVAAQIVRVAAKSARSILKKAPLQRLRNVV